MSSKRLVSCAVAALVASGIAILPAQSLEQSAPDARRFYADDPLRRDDDMRNIPPPAEHDLSKSYEFVANTFGDTARSFGPALNVNTLGEVPDSSWFTNRLGQQEMTIDEILRGPNQVDGPAAGPWQVTGRPDSGITPKFTIRDARGDTYLIKLDPPSNPELPSSVEIISTKISSWGCSGNSRAGACAAPARAPSRSDCGSTTAANTSTPACWPSLTSWSMKPPAWSGCGRGSRTRMASCCRACTCARPPSGRRRRRAARPATGCHAQRTRRSCCARRQRREQSRAANVEDRRHGWRSVAGVR